MICLRLSITFWMDFDSRFDAFVVIIFMSIPISFTSTRIVHLSIIVSRAVSSTQGDISSVESHKNIG